MKKLISFGVGLLLITLPILVSAQTLSASDNSSLIASLEQLIMTLTQEVNALIAARSQGHPTTTTNPTGTVTPPVSSPTMPTTTSPTCPTPYQLINGRCVVLIPVGTNPTTPSSPPSAAPPSAPTPCTFGSHALASGASITAYQSPTVSAGQMCQSQARTCTNGTLSGTYTSASCSVGAAIPTPVASPTASISVNGKTGTVSLPLGSTFSLTWSSSNVSSCSASTYSVNGASMPWQIAGDTSPTYQGAFSENSLSYTISCVSASGTPVSATVTMQTPPPTGRYFSFAQSVSYSGTAMLSMGTVQLQAGGVAYGTVWTENALQTDFAPSAKLYAPLNAPLVYTGSCSPSTFHQPGILLSQANITGQWAYVGGVLTVSFPSITTTWVGDASFATDAWKLQGAVGGQDLEGYAFMSDINPLSIAGPKTSSALFPSYIGTEYQNGTTNPLGAWLPYGVGLTFSEFAYGSDSDVGSITNYINDASSKYGYYEVLRNDPDRPANMFFDAFSHDFNNDGCADDIDHVRVYYGIYDGGKITKAVLLESDGGKYSAAGTIPIIGIGRVQGQ